MPYRIQITRTGKQQGRLSYQGRFSATYDCWWDPKTAIPAGTYQGCSKTFLDKKKNSHGKDREGIYFPNVPGRFGIFIHYWPGPGASLDAWSDGCTLLTEPEMLGIWNDITPMNGHNVTIDVVDPVLYPGPQAPRLLYPGPGPR